MIIEDLRAGRSAKEIIRFFGYLSPIVYDVVTKYTALEQSTEDSSMPVCHSKERIARSSAVVERTQTLILDDPGQSLRKLASIVSVSESTMRRIAEEDFRYKSYTLMIRQMLSEATRTSRVVRLGSHSGLATDLNPLDYYVWSVVEKVKQVSTSQCNVIKDHY